MGQNPNLPHCNCNGRFTSDNGHYGGKPTCAADVTAWPLRGGDACAGEGLPAVPNMRPMVAGWTA